jgi:aspartyl-tRNA(Asn)/glutamyl-tRNA(Gln) amidotransferase subunit B
MPGVLPVLNRKALEYALRVAIAVNCEIVSPMLFERKNYYYPDLPKNYQISQKRAPLGRGGALEIVVPSGTPASGPGADGPIKRIGLEDVHLEEDTGKLLHAEEGDDSYIDYNRSGMPLLELVSAPDMRTLAEVQAYMNAVRDLLLYLGVSECRMELGQLRFEANISLRPIGQEELGPRVELKNLNSFRSVLRGLEYEMRRQEKHLNAGHKILRETRLWDEERGVTEPMRSKEEAQDYRYFPEPDLVPISISAELLETTRASLPELPAARRRRFVSQYALPEYDAQVLTSDKAIADFFESTVAAGADAKTASNWIMGEVLRLLKPARADGSCRPGESGGSADQLALSPGQMAQLLRLLDSGKVSGPAAKQVFEEMFRTGRPPEDIIRQKGLEQISDESELANLVERTIAENPAAVQDFKAGKEQSLKFLMGQVMRQTRGRANPQVVQQMFVERLKKL